MKIENALIEVGSSGAGLIAAKAAENNVPGIAGPAIALVAGGAAWYFGPKWAKNAGAVMAGYGALSAVKKVAFKAGKRSTVIMGKIEELLPGRPGGSTVNGLGMPFDEEFDDFELLDDGMDDGFDDYGDDSLAGLLGEAGGDFLEESLAGIDDAGADALAESMA